MTKPISALEIFDVYNRSKLANCLFIKELTKRLPPQVTANLVNPGTVATGIWRGITFLSILNITASTIYLNQSKH